MINGTQDDFGCCEAVINKYFFVNSISISKISFDDAVKFYEKIDKLLKIDV